MKLSDQTILKTWLHNNDINYKIKSNHELYVQWFPFPYCLNVTSIDYVKNDIISIYRKECIPLLAV